MIEIVVLGVPVAKGRPRFSRATGHAYTPEKTRNFEALLRLAAQDVMGDKAPLQGPLSVDMIIKLPISTSWTKKQQAAARSGALRPTKKPDFDNYAKTLDALNMVVWADDGQIVDGRVRKLYDDKPGMWVRVSPLDEGVFG